MCAYRGGCGRCRRAEDTEIPVWIRPVAGVHSSIREGRGSSADRRFSGAAGDGAVVLGPSPSDLRGAEPASLCPAAEAATPPPRFLRRRTGAPGTQKEVLSAATTDAFTPNVTPRSPPGTAPPFQPSPFPVSRGHPPPPM